MARSWPGFRHLRAAIQPGCGNLMASRRALALGTHMFAARSLSQRGWVELCSNSEHLTMSTTYPTTEARRIRAVEAGGATESMGGVAVVILAILSLVGVVPRVLTPVAGIIFGAAFIVEGAAIAARQANLAGAEVELTGGVTVELVAGLSAIVLGVLALIGVAIPVLMGALVITGGAALMLSAGLVNRMGQAGPAVMATPTSSAAAAHLLAGLAAVVLGILALTSAGLSGVLTTVALLVLGGSLMLSGTAMSTAMLRLFRQG
jgi:hypothetical protein